MTLTSLIKEFALDIGYCRVGVTTADKFHEHLANLEQRKDLYDFYLPDNRNPLGGATPMTLMLSARSIISLSFDYAQKSFPENLLQYVGRIYLARCYTAPANRINGGRYHLMCEFLREHGCTVGNGIFIPERWCGARSGATSFGRNNFAYASVLGLGQDRRQPRQEACRDGDSPRIVQSRPRRDENRLGRRLSLPGDEK
jgi:epoxyqueuosine reductase